MMKRLSQVSLQMPPSFAAGSLFMMAEVIRDRADIAGLFLEPEPASSKAPAASPAASSAVSARNPKTVYDPAARDPRFACAGRACMWEIAPLASHYHPSVRAFAEHLMASPLLPLEYNGDPMADFTVSVYPLWVSLPI